ncbi:MAG: L,D-transpeptidase family protein [Sulfurimonadaceae bacterium]|jgi:murein L,D-transpeptidase YafK|nr:L,D-transpeptidase family protein [Sulfurimonadaceae bacterium]
MKILLLLFISFNIFASDLLTAYRNDGIKDIQKQLDFELTKRTYWGDFLKTTDLTFGYIEKYSSLLACEKDFSKLSLYTKDENGTFTFKKHYDAFTGKAKGDKSKEGDLRTPIGIYDLTQKLDKLDSFYGPLAFVTSYPNLYDRYRNKNGSGIWIHGLPTEQERDEFTRGCIAINNSNIKCLEKRINIEDTLLIINESDVLQGISSDEIASLLAQLYEWRYTWIYNDLEGYLGFYSEDFKRFDGMEYPQFKKYKERIFAKDEKKTIIFKDINVIPYPNEVKTYQITFKEIYASVSFKFTGEKSLMVRLDTNNKMKIFVEK